jgi:hypothetical protein
MLWAMRRVASAVLAVGCGGAAAAPATVVNVASTQPCSIAVDHAGDRVVIDGVAVPDFEPDRLRTVLGAPSRVERVEAQRYYEESGESFDEPWTSTAYVAVDAHHVYDDLGLVFRTDSQFLSPRETPEILLVFLAAPRPEDQIDVAPADHGRCRVVVDGEPVAHGRIVRIQRGSVEVR